MLLRFEFKPRLSEQLARAPPQRPSLPASRLSASFPMESFAFFLRLFSFTIIELEVYKTHGAGACTRPFSRLSPWRGMSGLWPASVEGQLGAFRSSHVICRGRPPAPKRVTFSLALCTLSRTGAGGDVLGGMSTPTGQSRGPQTAAWPASGRVCPGAQGLWVAGGWGG